MVRGFRVKGDIGGAGLGEIRDDAIHGLHHEMHVDGRVDAVCTQRRAHQWADAEVGDIVIVHDVEMDHVGPGLQYRIDFFAEAGEVRGQNGRGNQWIVHGRISGIGRD